MREYPVADCTVDLWLFITTRSGVRVPQIWIIMGVVVYTLYSRRPFVTDVRDRDCRNEMVSRFKSGMKRGVASALNYG